MICDVNLRSNCNVLAEVGARYHPTQAAGTVWFIARQERRSARAQRRRNSTNNGRGRLQNKKKINRESAQLLGEKLVEDAEDIPVNVVVVNNVDKEPCVVDGLNELEASAVRFVDALPLKLPQS